MERAASVLIALALCACSLAAPTQPSATAAPTTSAAPTGTVSASGPWTFTVDSSSKTTVRVREVLAQIRAPGDAVLTATGMKGSFTLNTDGSFASGSKITADLTTLRSDQSQRDSFIKDNTLETRRFPTAEFVPEKAAGVTLPLPISGELKLTATATADPAWKFGDFGMSVPRVVSVLSIEDDIRVEISLVATETA